MARPGMFKDDWCDCEEARRIIGYKSKNLVSELAKNGLLVAMKDGHRWKILRESAIEFARKRRPNLLMEGCPACGGEVTFKSKHDSRWKCTDCRWYETARGMEIKKILKKLLESPDEELRDGIKRVIGFSAPEEAKDEEN